MVTVKVENIPDSMFNIVNKNRELRSIRMVDRKKLGLPSGSPDIQYISVLGDKGYMSRADMMENFKNIDGSKIKMSNLHYGVTYRVIRDDSKLMAMYYISNKSNITYTVYNKDVKGGSILIIEKKDNTLDKSKVKVISKSDFTKSFEVVKLADKDVIKSVVDNVVKSKQLEVENKAKETLWRAPKKVEPTGKLEVVSKLMSNGKIVGFEVTNKGRRAKVNLSKAKQLCRDKQIRNMTIVYKDGKEFLRGVGIKINNLPSLYIASK